MIATENDYKKYLLDADRNYQGQKTWETLFSNVDLNRQRQLAETNYDYGMAMNEAYQQAYLNEQNIRGTSLIGSAKQRLIDENTMALEQAFKTFSQQKAQAAANIDANAATLNESLSTTLSERAANFKAFDESHYGYLERLYEDYGDTELFTDENSIWSMYLTDKDPDGNLYVDAKGNPTGEKRLMTRDELFKYQENEQGENIGFYDKNGNLTIRGMDFYDKMENALAGQDKYLRYQDYLKETNPDLYEWANTADAYNFTETGTNLGSFNTVFGQTSADFKYQFAERFGGLTSGELEKKFEKFKNYATEYSKITDKTSGGNRVKKNAEITTNMAKELKALTDNLGITDDIEKELGIDFTTYVNNIVNLKDSMYSGGDNFLATLDNAGKGVVKGIGIGASTGAGVGAVGGGIAFGPAGIVPVAGFAAGVGAIIGGFIGGIAGLFKGSGENKQENEQYEAQLEQAYITMVDQLVLYARNKKSEIDKQYQ